MITNKDMEVKQRKRDLTLSTINYTRQEIISKEDRIIELAEEILKLKEEVRRHELELFGTENLLNLEKEFK